MVNVTANRRALLVLSIASILLLAGLVSADGGVIPNPYGTAFAPEQKAAIFWDGSTEKMILSTKIVSDDSTAMAWVVPIQSSSPPTITQADNAIFFDLANLFSGLRVYDRAYGGIGLGAAAQNAAGVEVVQSMKIDVYDVTVLKATNASALLDWLNENGFAFPSDRKGALDYYVQRGSYYFVANKIDLLNEYPNATVGETERACAGEIWVYADSYGRNASETAARVEMQIQGQFSAAGECANASFDAVRALVELREGIATPLEFVFTPERPFYPMAISGINEGNTLADVYVFGAQCFDDASGLLQFKHAVKNNTLAWEYGLGRAEYVTMLEYDGPASALSRDSFFTEKPFSPEYDPNYRPLASIADAMPGALVLTILLLALVVLPMLVVGALTAHFTGKKKKHARRAGAIGALILLCAALLPGMWLLLLAPSLEMVLPAIIVTAVYSMLPAAGFAAGYFAVKEKKWWIAVAGVAAIAALVMVMAAVGFLLFNQ
ncbi:hypothetical protein AUJ16_02710 [Candidatus Micrarchaeota archaeon CG1_02_60_51]|nr:MAG: hypothetical protein AUJ16_02710 [Candidatus Micrarchaeota archaeon CG1_02_60_51]